jgi:hypothetical protein
MKKKYLLFALGALMSMSVAAQEEDVTHYIQNAGFDQDLTWQADGSKKEIVDQTKVLSDRSIAGIAADSSVYALVNPSTPKKRSDGRTLEATNGFIARIQGWTVETNNDFPKCEWVYFGSLPYALGETAIPVADDGGTYITVPEKPSVASGDDNVGFAYLRAGWGGRAVYKQVVKLPCAKYRLEYWAVNLNTSATNGKNLSKVTCRKDTWEDETGFNDTEWTKHEIEFTPTAEFSMQFGFESSGGSGSNPFLCIDGIKLYKIGEADPDELLSALIVEFEELQQEASSTGYQGLSAQIGDYAYILDDYSGGAASEVIAAVTQGDKDLAKFREALAETSKIDAMLAKMDNLLKTTNYAGKADFQTAYEDLLYLKQNDTPDENTDIAVLMLAAVEKAKAAIKAYYLSQMDTASIENPADFTIFVQNPWFITEDAEPILEDGEWVFPLRYDAEGNDLYKEGDASSPDLTSGGWQITGASGGDQRLNWQRGRSCWNAWNSNFEDLIAVGQTITDLPNGYYTVAADMITQSGYANGTQCVYAEGVTGKTVSAQKLISDDYDNSVWETISMTAEEKVIVVDGKLTIGAQGIGDGNASAGWFLATNFKLYYLGKASDADIASAVKTAFDAKVTDAKDLAGKMMLKGDQKTLNDTIAKYEVAADKDAYLAAIEALNAAITEANNSEAKYYDYLPTEATLEDNPDLADSKTLLWVKRLLDGEEIDDKPVVNDDNKAIVQFAYDYVQGWLKSDTATYTKFDATVDLLKNYVNTYIPAYNEAAEVAAAAKETGKTMLNTVMADQKAKLVSEMQTKETVDQYVADLKEVMNAVEKQNIYEDTDASDYTAYIMNPNAEATTGWEIVLGNGDGNGQKSGQWMDDSGVRYFDSYHSQTVTDAETGEETHTGLVGFKFSQLIEDLPNGTYTVGAYTRTPAEGAYIFAGTTDQDTTFVEIPLNYYEVMNDETGEMEQVVASDKYGPIWEAAKYQVEDLGDYTEEEQKIYNANSNQGRGWKHQEIAGIVVTNHVMYIGSQCGTAESKTEKVFAGDWYSVGGWTLTLTAKGNNDGWNGPVTAIETVKGESKQLDGIYTIMGVKAQKMQRGLNIIVRNGKAMKVMVK